MKVLRVVPTMNPQSGGVCEAVNQSASGFSNLDDSMTVACFNSPEAEWFKASRNYEVVPLGRGWSRYAINIKAFLWILKNAKNFDCVVFDGLWQFHMVCALGLRLFTNTRYFVFTHGMLDPYFNKLSRLKYIKKLPFWFLVERNSISGASGVLFTCEEERRLAALSFPFYKAKPKVVGLGIEPNYYGKEVSLQGFHAAFPELKGKRFLLFMSRIDPKKGIDLFISAFAKVAQDDPEMMIVIAGPDRVGQKKKLVELSEKLNISHRIVWTGMIKDEVKWGAFYSAEAFVLPSHQENFGIVVAEALSVGVPVLISDKVNIWREVSISGAGIVKPDTVSGIRELLSAWLSKNDRDRSEMSINAKVCFKKYFYIESCNEIFREELEAS